jgi:hypothetical protein
MPVFVQITPPSAESAIGLVECLPTRTVLPGDESSRARRIGSFLAKFIREEDIKLLRSHEQTGRPLGDEEILATLEENLGRI